MPAPKPDPEGLAINVLGMVPLGEHATREANFFRAPFGDLQEEQITSIFLPDPSEPQVAYGPSYVSADVQLHSPIAEPVIPVRAARVRAGCTPTRSTGVSASAVTVVRVVRVSRSVLLDGLEG